jgi:predicted anti-sigma-YlaC factor YlaD
MMSHLDFDELNGLLDGHVSVNDRPRLEGHLARCAECKSRYERLEALVVAAHALPSEVEPPPELWLAVHRQLVSEQPRPRIRWWQLAAAAVLLIALSSVVTARLVRRTTPTLLMRHDEPRPPVRAVDADYGSIVQQLTEALAQRRSQLDPKTVAKVEASLRVIDAALAEARAALVLDPANRDLLDLIAATYRQKVDLLRRANELPSST